MRRWIVFVGWNYYPSGGIDDYQGSYDTEAQAIEVAQTEIVDEHSTKWSQVVRIDDDGTLVRCHNFWNTTVV